MQWGPNGIRTALSVRYVSCSNHADDRNAVTGLPIVYSFLKTGKHSVPSATESWSGTRYIYATFYTAHSCTRSLDLLLQALLLMSVRLGTVASSPSHSIFRYIQARASHSSRPRRQSGPGIGNCMLHCSLLTARAVDNSECLGGLGTLPSCSYIGIYRQFALEVLVSSRLQSLHGSRAVVSPTPVFGWSGLTPVVSPFAKAQVPFPWYPNGPTAKLVSNWTVMNLRG